MQGVFYCLKSMLEEIGQIDGDNNKKRIKNERSQDKLRSFSFLELLVVDFGELLT